MSTPFASGPNPYASPIMPAAPPPIVPLGPLPTSMEYLRSYGFIFENPNWLSTVLLLALCWLIAFIPGIGIIVNLVFLGYQFEVVDWLLRTHGQQYPGFDFGRLGDYVMRGLWPFLVYLVAVFVALPVLYIAAIIGFLAVGGIASAVGDDAGAVLGFILGAGGFLLFAAAFFTVMIYISAMVLRSGLSQDFASAFQIAWINDFVRRMWVELVLAGLFLWATMTVLEILGILALCVGLFFALALVTLAFAHILYQLYAVYLSRGGIPVSPTTGATQTFVGLQPGGMPPGYPPKPPV